MLQRDIHRKGGNRHQYSAVKNQCPIGELLHFWAGHSGHHRDMIACLMRAILGNITQLEVDAIVNAANSALVLGAGVAGAIRDKGGPTIQAECDAIGPIAVGDAVVTGAGNLKARFVIHAAGMPPGGASTEQSIRSCVARSLVLANENACRSVAIPAIGAGIGGFSTQRCAEILLEEARLHLAGSTGLEEVRFVLFGEPAFRVFEMSKDAAAVAAGLEKLRARRTAE